MRYILLTSVIATTSAIFLSGCRDSNKRTGIASVSQVLDHDHDGSAPRHGILVAMILNVRSLGPVEGDALLLNGSIVAHAERIGDTVRKLANDIAKADVIVLFYDSPWSHSRTTREAVAEIDRIRRAAGKSMEFIPGCIESDTGTEWNIGGPECHSEDVYCCFVVNRDGHEYAVSNDNWFDNAASAVAFFRRVKAKCVAVLDGGVGSELLKQLTDNLKKEGIMQSKAFPKYQFSEMQDDPFRILPEEVDP